MKDKSHITTLCGFEPDQAEADLSSQELTVGDAILLAFDLKKNSALVKLECAQEPQTTEVLTPADTHSLCPHGLAVLASMTS